MALLDKLLRRCYNKKGKCYLCYYRTNCFEALKNTVLTAVTDVGDHNCFYSISKSTKQQKRRYP